MIYAIMRTDGGVSIMHTVGDVDPQAEIAKWPPEEQAKVASFAPITKDDIPKDRTFRDAWTRNGSGKVECDMPRARDIHRDRMRRARQPKLDALDRLHSRALGQGKQAEADEIEKQRQALRDVTAAPSIESAETPDELTAVWPSALS